MKIHPISDLHTEFMRNPFSYQPPEGTDLVVAAGDIGTGKQGMTWLLENFDIPVIYVAGNHEFYGNNWKVGKHYETLHDMAAGTHVHFLQDEEIEINGVLFFGATLWTDYELYGNSSAAMMVARQGTEILEQQYDGTWKKNRYTGMSDFSAIKTGRSGEAARKLTSAWVQSAHRVSRVNIDLFLEKKFNGPKVVVTHHAPSEQSLMADYRERKDPFNPCYASNLENLIAYSEGLSTWIHGHVHEAKDYQIYETRVVCNPRGYAGYVDEKSNVQKTGFDSGLLLEIN